MKKKARPHPESESHVLCPFCETPVDLEALERLCLGCGRRWSLDDAGTAIFAEANRGDRAAVKEAAGRERERVPRDGLRGERRRRPVRLGKKRSADR